MGYTRVTERTKTVTRWTRSKLVTAMRRLYIETGWRPTNYPEFKAGYSEDLRGIGVPPPDTLRTYYPSLYDVWELAGYPIEDSFRWTKEQDRHLLDWYRLVPVAELAELIGRSSSAIITRVKRLGIKNCAHRGWVFRDVSAVYARRHGVALSTADNHLLRMEATGRIRIVRGVHARWIDPVYFKAIFPLGDDWADLPSTFVKSALRAERSVLLGVFDTKYQGG
jgi:hypothetical protein